MVPCMKTLRLGLCVSAVLCLSAGAAVSQEKQDESLPAAPSSAIAPTPVKTAPKPTPKPTESKPAASTAPAFETLEDPLLKRQRALAEKQKAAEAAAAKAAATKQEPAKTAGDPAKTAGSNADDLLPIPDKDLPPAPAKHSDPARVAPGAVDESVETIRVRANEVPVIFTVTDKRGRFIRNLKREDLVVFDDGRPVSEVRSFAAQSDLPLRVGLLIDASNSIRDRFKFEQEAAIEFLNQIIRPRSDKAFVLGFDTTAEITQDFTNKTELLSHGVRMLRPGGGTALFDALYLASRDKLLKQSKEENLNARRAIILLSDGDDNQSRVTREEAIEMALRAEVIVYCISTSLSPDKGRGDKTLERIAEATGGKVFFPFKIQDVANAFSDIQDELRSQYALSYKPADFKLDGRYRSIQITAANKKYRIRARQGYFAPKQ